jgi:hypothetical protein
MRAHADELLVSSGGGGGGGGPEEEEASGRGTASEGPAEKTDGDPPVHLLYL